MRPEKEKIMEEFLKRRLKSLIFERTDSASNFELGTVLIKNKNKKDVMRQLEALPKNVKFLSIINCESADFSKINLCDFENLISVNLSGTPNNLQEHSECASKIYGNQYVFDGYWENSQE